MSDSLADDHTELRSAIYTWGLAEEWGAPDRGEAQIILHNAPTLLADRDRRAAQIEAVNPYRRTTP